MERVIENKLRSEQERSECHTLAKVVSSRSSPVLTHPDYALLTLI